MPDESQDAKDFDTHRGTLDRATERSCLLVLAAHPDDETLGGSALLQRAPDRVRIVHVTNGSPRDRALWSSDAPRDADDYAALRAAELRRALSVVGVPTERLMSLGAVDQEACLKLVELTRALVGILLDMRPALLLTHPYEGGHPDHDASAFIARSATERVRRTSRTAAPLLEMTSYRLHEGALRTGAFLRPAGPEIVHSLSPAQRARKRLMLDCFASQAAVLSPFGVEQERFRLAPRYDFRLPPHPGPLCYERPGWPMSGARFCALSRVALEQL